MRLRAVLRFSLLIGMVACASDQEPRRAPRESTPDAFASIEKRATATPSERKAAPRWEEVAVWTGSGPGSESFSISRDAIQWRADWTCESGTVRLETDPSPRSGRPLVENQCPGAGQAYSVQTGRIGVNVTTSGPWRIAVSQQVTTPVDERPLPQMMAPGARPIAEGDFFAIERKGKGKAILYRLPDGALALRLEGFETSANTDLFVWASEAPRPTTSKEALESPYVVLAELKSTIGDQNYPVPPGIDTSRIRSIVIWCQPVQIAYVASALEPSGR